MRKVKGFTLVECIVALAVLGIASLTMAQIYANVSTRNRNNHLVNTSLSNQMAYVEQYTSSHTTPFYYGNSQNADAHADDTTGDKKPPQYATGGVTAGKHYVTIKKLQEDKTNPAKVKYTAIEAESYSFPVDLYVMNSHDQNGNASYSYDATTNTSTKNTSYKGEKEDKYNLRYKYILGHKN